MSVCNEAVYVKVVWFGWLTGCMAIVYHDCCVVCVLVNPTYSLKSMRRTGRRYTLPFNLLFIFSPGDESLQKRPRSVGKGIFYLQYILDCWSVFLLQREKVIAFSVIYGTFKITRKTSCWQSSE